MNIDVLAALLVFAFVSSITPGPNNMMLVASGANFGFVRTLPHMTGVTLGFALMLALVGAGLAQVFIAYPVIHDALKVISCAYLLWLAWRIASAGSVVSRASARDGPMTFGQAALFQWVNPKGWAAALAATSVYIQPTSPLSSLALVVAVFAAIMFPSIAVWVLLGVQLQRFLQRPRRLRAFNIAAALALVASLYPIITAGPPGPLSGVPRSNR